jgi:hypothetical protein
VNEFALRAEILRKLSMTSSGGANVLWPILLNIRNPDDTDNALRHHDDAMVDELQQSGLNRRPSA